MAFQRKLVIWAASGLLGATAFDFGSLSSLWQDTALAIVRFPSDELLSSTDGETAAGVLPVVMMHGMGDYSVNPMGMVPLRNLIAKTANTYVTSVAICSKPEQLDNCDTEDQSNGFFMTMDDQVEQFARVVKADPKLANGFNAVGFSQGNTIIRGYIHRHNNPPVKNFVSMHGVLMGVAGLPQCPMETPVLGMFCRTVDKMVSLFGVYSSYFQNHLAQANYYRDSTALARFRAAGHYLPDINNEIPGKSNSTYADNFKALEKLVLVMAEGDTMVHPKESEHFGYFKDGSATELVAMQDAPWYKEDWFGLKTLDEAKKIDTYSTPGNHLRFTEAFLVQMVQKYFTGSSVEINV